MGGSRTRSRRRSVLPTIRSDYFGFEELTPDECIEFDVQFQGVDLDGFKLRETNSREDGHRAFILEAPECKGIGLHVRTCRCWFLQRPSPIWYKRSG